MAKLPVPVSRPQLPEKIFTGESEGGAAALGKMQQGRALSNIGQDIGQLGEALQRRQVQREVSSVSADVAAAQAELTVAWQEALRTADPNDPDLAERFRNEQVAPRLQKIGEKANSRDAKLFYEKAAAGLGSSFLVTTEQGAASLAETAAVQNWQETLNRYGDAVTADPASFHTSIPTLDVLLEGMVQANGLSREQALVLETEGKNSVAFAAARGVIDRNAPFGKEAVESGEYAQYLRVEQKQRLIEYADAKMAADARAEDDGIKQAADAAAAEYLRRTTNPDGSMNVTALPDILAGVSRDPALARDPAQQRAVFNLVRGLASGDDAKVSNPAILNHILRETNAGRMSFEEASEYVGAGISYNDLQNQVVPTLRRQASPDGQAENERLKNHLSDVEERLGISRSLFAIPDARANDAFRRYQDWFYREFERRRSEGKTVDALLNPNSPEFLGQELGNFVDPNVNSFGQMPVLPSSYQGGANVGQGRIQYAPTNTPMRSPEELDRLLSGEE